MKTFKQFISEVQKMSSMKEYGDKSEDPTNFLRNTGIPIDLAKKKKTKKNIKTA